MSGSDVKILILGYSSIARRRILPALQTLGIRQVDIASFTNSQSTEFPEGMNVRILDDYSIALSEGRADLVYISTENGSHARWAREALERGYNVVVDKPAFTTYEDTLRLMELARNRKCFLAEANVYPYHPRIQAAKDAFEEVNSRPTCMSVIFSFPPLDSGNFRYHKNLGGGAILDLGPYAVSSGRVFFGEEPEEIFPVIRERGREVEISFSVLATYSGGRAMVGHFGFKTGYSNRMELLGPDVTVTMDRVFTPPADLETTLDVQQKNCGRIVSIAPADTFALFIYDVIEGIRMNRHERFAKIMQSDAKVLNKLLMSE